MVSRSMDLQLCSDLISLIHRIVYGTLGNPTSMTLRTEWANSLNGVIPNSSSTLLANLMDQVYNGTVNHSPSVLHWPVQGQSLVLSAVVADALGRIGNEYKALWCLVICRNGWCSTSPAQSPSGGNPVLFNGTAGEWASLTGREAVSYYVNNSKDLSQQVMYSFPQPHDYQTQWTEISLQVNRYGYGWGFNSKVVKAAAAILIVHAIIIVAHCCHLIISGKVYSYADSIGELVALALKSQPPRVLSSSNVGVSSGKSVWSQPTAVRKAEGLKEGKQQFEIVVGPEVTKPKTRSIRQRSTYCGNK